MGVLLVAWSSGVRAGGRELAIDFERSCIEVAVKATVDSFVGNLTAYRPSIAIGDDGTVTAARVAFRFRDLETGKRRRDEAMHKWQQTEANPDGVFVLTSLEAKNDTVARGRLTLHGMTREIRFPISIQRDGPLVAIDGDAPIDTREFDLPVIRMLGLLKVDPIVHVRFHLQGSSLSAGAASR